MYRERCSPIGKVGSNAWLDLRELFLETKEFVTPIRDQVVNTMFNQKHIIKNGIMEDN